MARINQNLSDIKDEDMGGGGWVAWEQGEYAVMVVASEYLPTSAGNGHFLKLELVCMEGEHQGQKKFDTLVLEHPNATTTKIARAKLKELAIAVGHRNPDQVDDSEDLHNKTVLAYITKKKAKDPQYGDKDGFENNVAGYNPYVVRRNSPQAAARPRPRPGADAPQEPARFSADEPLF